MLTFLDSQFDTFGNAGHDLYVVATESQLLGHQAGDGAPPPPRSYRRLTYLPERLRQVRNDFRIYFRLDKTYQNKIPMIVTGKIARVYPTTVCHVLEQKRAGHLKKGLSI